MNTNNPFDFTKMFEQFSPKAFEQFDPKAVAEKIQDAFKIDFDAIKEAQDKNMDVMMSANKAIVEGSQSLLERQTSMLQQAMEEATTAAKELASSASPQDVATKQADLLQAAYAKALANSAEISEMAKKTQEEITEKVNERIAESLKEFKETIAKIS